MNQFCIAFLLSVGFYVLAKLGTDDLHNHLKLAPLPTAQQMRDHDNAEATLRLFAEK